MHSRILILGKNGQVGGALISHLGDMAVGIGRTELDLCDIKIISTKLEEISPSAIINASAYTAVDKAEEEESLANTINAKAVAEIAKYAFSHGIPFIHYSTDYVFSGNGSSPWKETDKTSPISAYGKTKLAGEKAIETIANQFDNPKWLVFRTSWVYNEAGKNFLTTMLRLGKEREVLSVINDQIGSPTYSADIAKYSIIALKKASQLDEFPTGIYHLCNSEYTSWFGFAEEIFKNATKCGVELEVCEVKEIPTKDYPTAAKRPLNSRMNTDKLYKTFGIKMPSWKNALKRCILNK